MSSCAHRDPFGSSLRIQFRRKSVPQIMDMQHYPGLDAMKLVTEATPPCVEVHEGRSRPVYFATTDFPDYRVPGRAFLVDSEMKCYVWRWRKGKEESVGRFTVLLFDPNVMKLLRTVGGQVPKGERPIEAGYQEVNGVQRPQYHVIVELKGGRRFIGSIVRGSVIPVGRYGNASLNNSFSSAKPAPISMGLVFLSLNIGYCELNSRRLPPNPSCRHLLSRCWRN